MYPLVSHLSIGPILGLCLGHTLILNSDGVSWILCHLDGVFWNLYRLIGYQHAP